VIEDAAWIRNMLEALTTQQEASFSERWTVSDAPHEFVAQRIEAIVGIEMVITKLIGKWKVSQNQPVQNQAGVVKGLRELGENNNVLEMAALVEKHKT
jgi:transcriptional regulator